MSAKRRAINIAIVGPPGVGKTSLVNITYWGSIKNWRDYQMSDSTLSPDYLKFYNVDGCEYATGLWDACDEEYTFSALMYRGGDVVLLCFSIVDRDSFSKLGTFYSTFKEKSPNVPVLLVGLKLDLVSSSECTSATEGSIVTFEEGVKASLNMGTFGYFQCSSHTGQGCDDLFIAAIRARLTCPTRRPKKGGFFSFFSFSGKSKPRVWAATAPEPNISIETVVQTRLGVLPNALWLEILSFLDYVTLIRLTRTCKKFYHLCKTEPLWTNARTGPWNSSGISNSSKLSFDNKHSYIPLELDPLPDYNPPESVCFGPNATITLANGQLCKMKELKVGDQVTSGTNCDDTAFVNCIWRCVLKCPVPIVHWKMTSTTTGSQSPLLEITPDHPILVNDTWCLPTVLSQAAPSPHVTCLYNIVVIPTNASASTPPPSPTTSSSVDQQHTANNSIHNNSCGGGNHHTTAETEEGVGGGVVVGGVVCCTLGMTVPGFEEPFWGTHRVVDWLMSRPDFPNVCSWR